MPVCTGMTECGAPSWMPVCTGMTSCHPPSLPPTPRHCRAGGNPVLPAKPSRFNNHSYPRIPHLRYSPFLSNIIMTPSTPTPTTPHSQPSLLAHPGRTLLLLLGAAVLSACGGGGGDSPAPAPTPTPEPTPTPTPLSATALQGRWATAAGITPARTGIVLPTSTGGTELWLLASDFSSLARLSLSTSGTDGVSASGKTYALPSSSSQLGQSASYSGTANLSNNSLSLNSGTLLLTRSDELKTPASQSAISGNWRASVGGQSVTLAWSIGANGTLSGPGSSGCSYSGAITARSDAAYNASLTETCPNASALSFAGIATYRAAQGSTAAALTLALTRSDASQSQALVVGLVR